MRDGNCKHCGKPKEHRERGRCNACMAIYVSTRRKADIEKHRKQERDRFHSKTEEEKQAIRDRKSATRRKWLDSDPEIRKRHAAAALKKRKTWSPERKVQQAKGGKRHYTKLQLRKELGLCAYSVVCNEPCAGDQKFCLYHWCRGLKHAELRVDVTYTEDELLALWHKQEGRCAITGLPIIPGRTAVIDHIVPLSKGGDGTIANVRFVHTIVNRMKWDSSESEFIEAVKALLPALQARFQKDIDGTN